MTQVAARSSGALHHSDLSKDGLRMAYQPAGPQALLLERLGEVLVGVAAVVFLLVMAMLLVAAFRRRQGDADVEDPARERRMAITVAWATGVTVVVLVVVMLLSFDTGRRLVAAPPSGALEIRVTGHRWWWQVEYLDSAPSRQATTANEIHVPVGRPVALELRATDVIHSLWIPGLGVKRDMIPGESNAIWFQADRPGIYRGQCAEFCGHQHAKMGFTVVAEPPEHFAVWLNRQRDSARTPADPRARRGRDVFLASSCKLCHAVAGTPAGGRAGPDLTHVASRLTLAAGALPNRRGYLASWIVDPQRIKPGVLMPSNRLPPDQLHALLAYLEGLR